MSFSTKNSYGLDSERKSITILMGEDGDILLVAKVKGGGWR